jgi:hypothetical protein
LLSINTYLDLEKKREEELEAEGEAENSENSTNLFNYFSKNTSAKNKDTLTESIHIHNKAIFDAYNEALSLSRLYGGKPAPLPWDYVQPLKISNSRIS